MKWHDNIYTICISQTLCCWRSTYLQTQGVQTAVGFTTDWSICFYLHGIKQVFVTETGRPANLELRLPNTTGTRIVELGGRGRERWGGRERQGEGERERGREKKREKQREKERKRNREGTEKERDGERKRGEKQSKRKSEREQEKE